MIGLFQTWPIWSVGYADHYREYCSLNLYVFTLAFLPVCPFCTCPCTQVHCTLARGQSWLKFVFLFLYELRCMRDVCSIIEGLIFRKQFIQAYYTDIRFSDFRIWGHTHEISLQCVHFGVHEAPLCFDLCSRKSKKL